MDSIEVLEPINFLDGSNPDKMPTPEIMIKPGSYAVEEIANPLGAWLSDPWIVIKGTKHGLGIRSMKLLGKGRRRKLIIS